MSIVGGVSELHDGLKAYVARAAAAPPAWEQPIEALRAGPEAENPEIWGEPDAVEHVEDRDAGGVRVRVYRPAAEGPLPALVWFHGGGWAVGSLDSHDPLCRALAARTPCVVVAVDYRLAPEHPFPAGLEDAWSATEWTFAHAAELGADAERISVGGDSSGGNLAAVVALRARDRGVALARQILVYPVADFDFERPSYAEHATGLNLTTEKMRWYWRLYLDGADGTHPDASPLRADLHGVAPAVVITASHDVLRSEGEEYARRLEQAGVPVKHRHYDGMIHGFLRMPRLVDDAATAVDEIAAALR
ncbi:MAG: alpha/beta hydrolase [Actinobacteria bacterium]|nr:alpha/beta hydrolase [Actinomycetota bacterium]